MIERPPIYLIITLFITVMGGLKNEGYAPAEYGYACGWRKSHAMRAYLLGRRLRENGRLAGCLSRRGTGFHRHWRGNSGGAF